MTKVQTAIHVVHGYELYRDGEKPFVIRRWKTRQKNAKGELIIQPHEQRLALNENDFPPGVQGKTALRELQVAWKEWQSWNLINRQSG